MIELNKINIRYDKDLINNGIINIVDGKITGIIGESGVGKTSLLYLIGLISSNKDYRYVYDGISLDLFNEKEISNIKKTKIGYIFQDNSIIEELNVAENIRLAANIAGVDIKSEEIREYLSYVKLDIDENIYPRQLSGGEKQRLAIACVLAKKCELIIADEPTASLDEENTNTIMNIFKEIVSNGSSKVVIATHNSNVKSECDIVYEIKDKTINIIKGINNLEIDKSLNNKYIFKCLDTTKLNCKFYYNYAKQIYKRGKWQKNIMIYLCAIAIAFTSVISIFGNSFFKEQSDIMNKISNREIFLVNRTLPSSKVIDMNENLSIEDQDLDSLKKIKNIDKMYPYFEFRSIGYDIESNKGVSSCDVTVKRNGSEEVFNFNSLDSNYDKILVIPYFEEQNLSNRLVEESNDKFEEKIYITSKLANMLKINNLKDEIILSLDKICIPVANHKTILTSENTEYDIDVDISNLKNLEFRIAGILDESVINTTSAEGDNIIFIPINLANQIIKEEQLNFNKYDSIELPVDKWEHSAYTIYAKNYNDVQQIMDKVESINPNFKTVSKYQDIQSMNDMINNIKRIMMLVGVIILIVIFLLMTIIHMNNTLGRKYEISLLKANGLTRFELMKLIMIESFRHIIYVTIVSIITSLILINIFNIIFNYTIVKFDKNIVLINLFVSILSIILPTVISVRFINKFSVEKLMRN